MFLRLVLISLLCYGLLASSTASAQPLASAPSASATPTNNAPAAPLSPLIASALSVKQAMVRMNANDLDGALTKLDEAILLDPRTTTAYVLRGSIYTQKKMWPDAESDFKMASLIDPSNIVIKLNIVELKFMQKQYDEARAGYAKLQGDSDVGDLAKYKVFLCDLYGGHAALAAKELAVFNDIGSNPSYYYSNIAWDLYHNQTDDARDWLKSATEIYSPQKNAYYAQPLKDLGYLPLPAPAPRIRI